MQKVLIIEDHADMRELLSWQLELMGFMPILAKHGKEGIEKALAEKPELILMDIMMPGMDGWETCTQIKCDAVTADIPVILLTGANDRDLTQHANAVGASALLQKPC
ncbi:MAG TPA: response regulator, partial [Candidatus Binatia bacterium]